MCRESQVSRGQCANQLAQTGCIQLNETYSVNAKYTENQYLFSDISFHEHLGVRTRASIVVQQVVVVLEAVAAENAMVSAERRVRACQVALKSSRIRKCPEDFICYCNRIHDIPVALRALNSLSSHEPLRAIVSASRHGVNSAILEGRQSLAFVDVVVCEDNSLKYDGYSLVDPAPPIYASLSD